MKKLMIAAAIVCAAVISQAATCNWSWATTANKYIYNPGGASMYSGEGAAYLFNTANYSQEQILTAWRGGTDLSTIDWDTSAVAANSTLATKEFSTTDIDTGVSTKAFFVIVEDDKLFISGTSTKTSTSTGTAGFTWNPETGSKKALNAGDVTFATGGTGWYAAVPEPTSGLLLLLGVAGLALRRRRA